MAVQSVQSFLQAKIEAGIFTGASVIFGRRNEKLIEVYAGTIGRNFSEPIGPSILYDLQSITKAVATAPLFIELLLKNKINLSDHVADFFPSHVVEMKSLLRDVTFKHLLTHSSGLSDSDLEGVFQNASELWNQMYSACPHFIPGSQIEYTDLGYRILGRALEGVLGVDLNSAVKTLVWGPLNLDEITFNPRDRMLTAATPDAHGITDDEQVVFLGGITGCDGVFSTAGDLFKFAQCQLSDRKTLEILNANVVAFGEAQPSYIGNLAFGPKTLGWEVNRGKFNYSGPFQNELCFEKAGGAGTFVWLDQKTQTCCVYLTNYGKPKPFDGESWNRLVEQIDPRGLSEILYAQV